MDTNLIIISNIYQEGPLTAQYQVSACKELGLMEKDAGRMKKNL